MDIRSWLVCALCLVVVVGIFYYEWRKADMLKAIDDLKYELKRHRGF